MADLALADAPLGALLLLGSKTPTITPLSRVAWRWVEPLQSPHRVRAGAIAFSGDLDGDGRSELAIAETSTRADDPCAHGGVRVYRGATSGLESSPAWRLADPPPMGEGTDHYARVGAQLARVDEIDGPRTYGLVVSATRTRVVEQRARSQGDGAAEPHAEGDGATADETDASVLRSEFCEGDELWVYRGDARTPSQRIFVAQGAVRRVVTGRVDADPHRELVVLTASKVLVFRGRAGGFEERAAVEIDDAHDDPQRWSDVAVGDVDGDGDGEIVLTFQYSRANQGALRKGAVHFDVLGRERRERALYAPSTSEVETAALRSVLVLRDRDGDRRDEIVIADPSLRAVLVYRGRSEGEWLAPDRVLRVPESAGALGVTLVDAGDVDGDRRDDIVVRAARDDGGMATLYVARSLRGELTRVPLPAGLDGFAYSIAGRSSSMSATPPRDLPPLARRCEVPRAQEAPEALVSIEAPMVRADRQRLTAALATRLQSLARCHEQSLEEDCNRSATASVTLSRDEAGVVTVRGIAWMDATTDALRDCVQRALSGAILERARPGADGPVTIVFRAAP